MKMASVAFVRTQGNALCVCVCVCVAGRGGVDLISLWVTSYRTYLTWVTVSAQTLLESLSTLEVFSRKPLQEEWLPDGNYAGGHSPLRLAADFS